MQRQIHDLGHLLITDGWFAAAPCGYFAESDQPLFLKLITPSQHGRTRHPDYLTDFGVRHPVSGQEQHLGSLHHTMRRTPRLGQGFQDFSLSLGYRQWRRCSTHVLVSIQAGL
jgi:hypothetical protein